MDPITVIALLASLASLIKASKSIVGVIETLNEGDRELNELLSDILVFTEALKGFDRVLRSRQAVHHISGSVVRSAIDSASETIKNLTGRLLLLSNTEILTIRRMRWAQHKSNLKTLHERLKEHNTVLQTFLALTHA
jgi:hypothetical protein